MQRILHPTDADVFMYDAFVQSLNISSKKEKVLWNYFRKALTDNRDGVFLSAYVTDKIEHIVCCYTVNAIWDTKHNSLPFWVIGYSRSVVHDGRSPREKHDELVAPIVMIMEQQGYFSFYMSRLVPVSMTWAAASKYIERAQDRSFKIDRYDSRVEALVDQPEDRSNYSELHKLLTPDEWPSHKKSAVIRHDLKYSERAKHETIKR